MAKEDNSSDWLDTIKRYFSFNSLEHKDSVQEFDNLRLESIEKEIDEIISLESGRDRVKKIFEYK